MYFSMGELDPGSEPPPDALPHVNVLNSSQEILLSYPKSPKYVMHGYLGQASLLSFRVKTAYFLSFFKKIFIFK